MQTVVDLQVQQYWTVIRCLTVALLSWTPLPPPKKKNLEWQRTKERYTGIHKCLGRLLKQWYRVRIRYLLQTQWKTLRTSRVTVLCLLLKSQSKELNLPLRQKNVLPLLAVWAALGSHRAACDALLPRQHSAWILNISLSRPQKHASISSNSAYQNIHMSE